MQLQSSPDHCLWIAEHGLRVRAAAELNPRAPRDPPGFLNRRASAIQRCKHADSPTRPVGATDSISCNSPFLGVNNNRPTLSSKNQPTALPPDEDHFNPQPSNGKILNPRNPTSHTVKMSFFRITLLRSAIGLPRRSTDVLKALGLKKRMATVFHAVTPSVAGQIMKVKEIVSVEEVDRRLTKQEVHLERKPDPGYYVEKTAAQEQKEMREY